MVLFILAAVIVLNYFIAEKLALLNLFYLPAILAGFVLGKRKALLTSIFSITAVIFYVFLNYDNYKQGQSVVSLFINIISWGSFLILCSIVVGHLHKENEKKSFSSKALIWVYWKYCQNTSSLPINTRRAIPFGFRIMPPK